MSVKVAVRVRPFNQREINLNAKCCIKMVRDDVLRACIEWPHNEYSG
jgi:hypothetical protein